MGWIIFWAFIAYSIGRSDGYQQAKDDVKRSV